jgi:hypothetical protein
MRACSTAWETLLDYREGRLSGEEAAQVRTHLEMGCASCERALADLFRLQEAFAVSELEHAPKAALKKAFALFASRQPATNPLQWIAQLIFDSRNAASPSFARGEAEDASQRLYRVEGFDVEVWEERGNAQTSYLIGQVLIRESGEMVTPEAVTLVTGEGTTQTARQDGGEFHFAEMLVGTYQISIRLPQGEIVLPNVAVGA